MTLFFSFSLNICLFNYDESAKKWWTYMDTCPLDLLHKIQTISIVLKSFIAHELAVRAQESKSISICLCSLVSEREEMELSVLCLAGEMERSICVPSIKLAILCTLRAEPLNRVSISICNGNVCNHIIRCLCTVIVVVADSLVVLFCFVLKHMFDFA